MKYVLLSILFIPCFTFSQVTVNNNLTVAQYVQNVLVGNGVTVSNIQYNGGTGNAIQEQVGSFNNVSNSTGISNGLIMGTGDVQMAGQQNVSDMESLGGGGFFAAPGTDPDLQSISTGTIFDECVIEFDFIPQGDTIEFNYVFASEEYEAFVCSDANDVFGFFLSGVNPSGGLYNAQNIALIPDPLNPSNYTSTPVSINTVNHGAPGTSGDSLTCDAIDPNWFNYNIYYTA